MVKNLNKKYSLLKNLFSYKEIIILLVTIAIATVFYFTSGGIFGSIANINIMLRIGPELGIIAIGVTLLMISREFDLSVGSALAFCSMVMVTLYTLGLNLVLATITTLGVGALIGCLNGLITVKFGIPSFITTLSTMMFWRGMVLIISAGYPKSFHPETASPLFTQIFAGEFFGVPTQFIWFVVFVVILTILLNRHRFGNWVYATGGNKEAARARGVNTNRTKIICFIIVGILVAFSAIVQSTRAFGAYALQGSGIELQVVAAVVVGGTPLIGGRGTIIGTFIGVMLIQIINTGLICSGAPGYWFQAFIGITILTAIILNVLIERRMRK